MINPLYKVSDIVTLKTHPLKNNYRIKGDSKIVPPIMLIKEVHIENKKKRLVEEQLGEIIASRIKYLCTYFDDNKMEFKDLFIYEPMLISFSELKYERISPSKDSLLKSTDLISEVQKYKTPKYDFGKILYLRTKKLEIYKKKSSKQIKLKRVKKHTAENQKIKFIQESVQYLVCYASPDFITSGLKLNQDKNIFFNDGTIRKIVSEKLVKVLWFNSNTQKNSEQYLPLDFFVDNNPMTRSISVDEEE